LIVPPVAPLPYRTAPGSAQDLDALDGAQWNRGEAGCDQLVFVDALAIEQDQGVLVAGHAKSAQVNLPVGVSRVVAGMNAAEFDQHFGNRRSRGTGDIGCSDDGNTACELLGTAVESAGRYHYLRFISSRH